MSKLLILIFLFSFAHAEGMDSDILDDIFKDAILFILFFGIISIISFIISKKNAEIYELKNPLQERKDATRKRKLIEMYLNSSSTKIKGKTAVLLELSKLLEKKTIDKEEFQILKDSLNIN